jgi:serine/threonine protein kinase
LARALLKPCLDMLPQSKENSEKRLRAVGRYRLTRAIASGGMATVYHALVEGLGGFSREFAVKICDPVLARDAEFAAMFLEEARLSARVHHPNVVATHDVGHDGSLYLVMDFVHGCRLSALLAALAKTPGRTAQVPLSIAARILLDVLAGIDAAHAARDGDGRCLGIVHRDVSPQNVLVGFDGIVRVSDFGIARAASHAAHTRRGVVKGKPGYMAPEQVTGDPVSRATDLFAVGVLAWEMLAGGRLFSVRDPFEFLGRILREDPAPPSTHRREVSPALDRAILRALRREPSERYPSAEHFARALASTLPPPATREELAEFVRRALEGSVSIPPEDSAATDRVELLDEVDEGDDGTDAVLFARADHDGMEGPVDDEPTRVASAAVRPASAPWATIAPSLAPPAHVAPAPSVPARTAADPWSPDAFFAESMRDDAPPSSVDDASAGRRRTIVAVLAWAVFCLGMFGVSFGAVAFLMTRGAEANVRPQAPVVAPPLTPRVDATALPAARVETTAPAQDAHRARPTRRARRGSGRR